MMLGKITYHPRIAEQPGNVTIDQHGIEMIGAVCFLGNSELASNMRFGLIASTNCDCGVAATSDFA